MLYITFFLLNFNLSHSFFSFLIGCFFSFFHWIFISHSINWFIHSMLMFCENKMIYMFYSLFMKLHLFSCWKNIFTENKNVNETMKWGTQLDSNVYITKICKWYTHSSLMKLWWTNSIHIYHFGMFWWQLYWSVFISMMNSHTLKCSHTVARFPLDARGLAQSMILFFNFDNFGVVMEVKIF